MILTLGTTPAVQRSMTFAHLEIDGVNRTADVHQFASGKSINATRVLHTLGDEVITIGFAGGHDGEFIRQDLDRAGVKHDLVWVEPNTRTCLTLINRADGSATELIEESKEVEPKAYAQLFRKLRELIDRAKGIVISGSLPPNAPAGYYAACTSVAVSAGKFVILDATGEPLRDALVMHPTVIKPNRHELAQTVGAAIDSDADLKSAIRQLICMGPRWTVVTDGAKETVASDGNKFWKISTPKVAVISPIGSGDSFAAGLASGLACGQSVPDACRLAVACGAANAMTALAGHLNKSEVNQLQPQITITEF